jgi:hypothetical protein
VRIAPDAEIVWADAPLGRHGRGLGDDKGRTTHGARTKMDHVPCRGQAILARVLAHGRYEDAVAECQAAERERVEQAGHDSILPPMLVRSAER